MSANEPLRQLQIGQMSPQHVIRHGIEACQASDSLAMVGLAAQGYDCLLLSDNAGCTLGRGHDGCGTRVVLYQPQTIE